MSVIAIAGGSGNLGRAIAEAIVAEGKSKVIVLARQVRTTASPSFTESASLIHACQVDEEKQKAIGATFVPVDYASVDSLVKALDQHNVNTVISTMNAIGQVEPELNLIRAADEATSTKRFIPSIWGVPYTAE